MANTSFPINGSGGPLLPSSGHAPAAAPAPIPLTAQVGIGILTLAFVLGFPGNLFVVWSVLCRVKKRSVTCLLVLNLAMADAFVLLSAPLFIRYLSGLPLRGWEFGSAVCKLVHYLSSVNMYVSIYLICLMSTDRCLAVTRPFMSQRMRTKRSLMIILLVVWLMAFILSLPMPFYRNVVQPYIPKSPLRLCNPHWASEGHRVFQYLFETVMSFLLPFTIITVCYSIVICRLRSAMFQRKGRGNRLILLIIGTFALFWLPYHLTNIIEVAGLLHGSTTLVGAAKTARPNVTAFAYFSSAINPVLYVFAGSSHIRQAGLSFMGRLFEATNSESRNGSMASRGTRTTSRSGSVVDEVSALRSLSTKLGKPFRAKHTETGHSIADGQGAGADMAGSELMTLASIDNHMCLDTLQACKQPLIIL